MEKKKFDHFWQKWVWYSWSATQKTYYPVGKFHGPKRAHETVTSVWSITALAKNFKDNGFIN